MSLFFSRNFSSISTLFTLPTTAIIANSFRHFLRIIKFRKGKQHRLNLRVGIQLRSREVTAGRCMKARQFCGPEENVWLDIVIWGRGDINHMRRRLCYFQTLFSQNKLLPKVQPKKQSQLKQFLFYWHKIWHNDREIATDSNRVGEITNCSQIIALWIILFTSLQKILQFYKTKNKRWLTWTNKNRRHGISMHSLLKLARWQMIAESENWATWDFLKENFW